jgi:hypothetical protein
MSVSDVSPFLNGQQFAAKLSLNAAGTPPSGDAPVFTAKTSKRVRDAVIDKESNEKMVAQLRDIILGPHQKLCEARFAEMLDIMAEQRDESEDRFTAIEEDIGQMKSSAARMETLFKTFDFRFEVLSDKIDDEAHVLQEAYTEAVGKLRGDFEQRMLIISDTLQHALKDLETDMRHGLLDLSGSFVAHMADEDKKWEKERERSLTTLEQRIAQWRAEVDDDRRQDMDDVAASLVDIGQRLMAMRGKGGK